METLLMRYTRMSNWAYLRPDSARTLFQSMPETMAAMGVTEDMIGEAETKERLIPVSMARVHTHTTPEEFDKVLDELIPDPENLMTPKDADELFGRSSEGFLDATAKAEEQRNEIEETSVAKTERDTAHVGRRPPPVTNSVSASPFPFFQKKLHPKRTVPTR